MLAGAGPNHPVLALRRAARIYPALRVPSPGRSDRSYLAGTLLPSGAGILSPGGQDSDVSRRHHDGAHRTYRVRVPRWVSPKGPLRPELPRPRFEQRGMSVLGVPRLPAGSCPGGPLGDPRAATLAGGRSCSPAVVVTLIPSSARISVSTRSSRRIARCQVVRSRPIPTGFHPARQEARIPSRHRSAEPTLRWTDHGEPARNLSEGSSSVALFVPEADNPCGGVTAEAVPIAPRPVPVAVCQGGA
jgi:hypothetical protein